MQLEQPVHWAKLFPKDGEIAIIESNSFFHPVNVVNDELSSDSDLKLTE